MFDIVGVQYTCMYTHVRRTPPHRNVMGNSKSHHERGKIHKRERFKIESKVVVGPTTMLAITTSYLDHWTG